MTIKMHQITSIKQNKHKGKVVMIGDSGVGKTSILLRYDGQGFTSCMSPTLTASFTSARVQIDDTEVELSIWDTAGQERFRAMLPMYTRKSVAAIFVYDMSRYDSFRHLDSWFNELERHISDRVVKIIMANKSDLSAARVISEIEGREYATSKSALYVETSALNGRGIETGIRAIAEQLLEYKRLEAAEGTAAEHAEQSAKERDSKPRSKHCCTIS